jgi:hypothetical protein
VNGPEESKPPAAPDASGKRSTLPQAPPPSSELGGSGYSAPKASKVLRGPPRVSSSGSQESTFANKVFGFNPFPAHDARHEQWETNARYAMEEVYRLLATARKTIPSGAAKAEEFLTHTIELYSNYFDIIAKRFSIFTVNGAASIALYENCLTAIIEHLKKKGG